MNYDWVIEEPTFLSQLTGECFYSPVFFAKADPQICWRLRIFPRGVNEESKNYLSLYLERVGGTITSPVTVRSNWLVSKNGSEIFSKSDEIHTLGLVAPLPNHFGWDKVTNFYTSINKTNFFHPQSEGVDDVTISCQLIYNI